MSEVEETQKMTARIGSSLGYTPSCCIQKKERIPTSMGPGACYVQRFDPENDLTFDRFPSRELKLTAEQKGDAA